MWSKINQVGVGLMLALSLLLLQNLRTQVLIQNKGRHVGNLINNRGVNSSPTANIRTYAMSRVVGGITHHSNMYSVMLPNLKTLSQVQLKLLLVPDVDKSLLQTSFNWNVLAK